MEERPRAFPVRRASTVASCDTMSQSSGSSSFVSRVHQKSDEMQGGEELELYEYGDPLEALEEPRPRPVLDDTMHHTRISDEQLQRVRHCNSSDSRLMTEVLRSLVMVNGADVLVLACGTSGLTRRLAEHSPARLDIVDIDEDAIQRACYGLKRAGLDTTTEISAYVDDAATFAKNSQSKYDLIICIHAIGQICRDQQSVDEYIADCRDILNEGGHLIVNHHVGFTERNGTRIQDMEDDAERYMAGGLGKFDSDANYRIDPTLTGCATRATWSTVGAESVFQTWEYRVFERLGPVERDVFTLVEPISYSRLQPMPTIERAENPGLFDLLYPVSARGIKTPVSASDESSIPRSRMMPKFDGEPAMVILGDEVCTVVSANYSGSFKAPFYQADIVCATAELCVTSMGDRVAVVTGVLSIGEKRCDPASEFWLAWARKNLVDLMAVGIVCNTPGLVKDILDDRLSFPGAPRGRSVAVDGVNVRVGERWNKFMKGLSTVSIDATEADMTHCLTTIAELPPRVRLVAQPWDDGDTGVMEYRVRQAGESFELAPFRARRDKSASDYDGKILVFLRGLDFLLSAAGPRSTRRLVQFLETG